jgi:hypothetical protein
MALTPAQLEIASKLVRIFFPYSTARPPAPPSEAWVHRVVFRPAEDADRHSARSDDRRLNRSPGWADIRPWTLQSERLASSVEIGR